MARLMRLAFLSWRDLAHPQAGGSELLVDQLARGMQARGHETALLCGGPVGERPYPVTDLGGTYTQYLRAPWAHRRGFADWDLLVDVENGIPYFSPLWRSGPILCLVHHVHTTQWAQHFPAPVAAAGRFVEGRLMPRAYRHTMIVAVSPSTATALAALGMDRGHLHTAILNGVGAPPAAAARSATPLFVTVGRLVPHKRVDVALDAWTRVQAAVGGRLVVIGDGPERGRLEARRLPGVEFAGRVDDEEKWRLLSQAWLLIHPAEHEGWGIVISEAAAVGTPAIGFDVPGVRDAIVEGRSGALVGTVEELADRWIALATDEGARAELGDGARHQAEGLHWDRSLDLFEGLARQATGAGGPSR